MPTLIEMPEVKVEQVADRRRTADKCEVKIKAKAAPAPDSAGPLLFAEMLLETSSFERRRRRLASTVSLVFQCLLVGTMLILPLMFTEALPTAQLVTYLVAPPPPPPPPPPAAMPVVKVVQTDMLNNGALRTPSRIPRKVEMIKEEEAPPPAAGVVGGVPGGIPGGQLSGVIGGIISSSSNTAAIVPKIESPKRVRVSQGVTKGLVVNKVEPKYPPIALAARITGVVLLKAVISRDGQVTELQTLSGHPLLVPAAIDAVKQWRYRPYLLNGVPVEVETTITVTFQFSS